MKKHAWIIAEAGVNHNGDLDMAMKLVDSAAEAGADAVKFQTFFTEENLIKNAPKAPYQILATGVEETQYDMVKKLELDIKAHQHLHEYCRHKGIEFLSTPFDIHSVKLLVHQLGLRKVKIASGEITNAPLLLSIARTGTPVFLSTGMSTLSDVENALGVLAFGYTNRSEAPSIKAFQAAFMSDAGQKALNNKVSLLHCSTEYPAPFPEVNLKVLETLSKAFRLPIGYSDHTEGIAISVAAVALGAEIIEKHITLDKSLPGPDHRASLEPWEFQAMVRSIRQVEDALGNGIKIPTLSERRNMAVARKSLVAARPIAKGEPFTIDNLAVKRPGMGKSPLTYWEVLGHEASRSYAKDEVID